jgi:hypothetical protein
VQVYSMHMLRVMVTTSTDFMSLPTFVNFSYYVCVDPFMFTPCKKQDLFSVSAVVISGDSFESNVMKFLPYPSFEIQCTSFAPV